MKSDIAPFRMYGNLYFVGSSKVSVHIIKTEVGLVMIDTGYPTMYDQILESMALVGLDPKEVCAIFHSHGHIDHFGGTLRLKALSGAKTYIGRPDNDIVNGTLDLSWAKELGLPREEPFNCDVLVDDGDCYTFGSTTIRCLAAPGHTAGVLAFFVNIEEDGHTIVAAMHGGVGLNTLSAPWLRENGLSLDCREIFREGLHRLAKEHVDLVMGNHPGQNNTTAKLRKVLAGESIINPEAWPAFLESYETRLDNKIKEEREQGIID